MKNNKELINNKINKVNENYSNNLSIFESFNKEYSDFFYKKFNEFCKNHDQKSVDILLGQCKNKILATGLDNMIKHGRIIINKEKQPKNTKLDPSINNKIKFLNKERIKIHNKFRNVQEKYSDYFIKLTYSLHMKSIQDAVYFASQSIDDNSTFKLCMRLIAKNNTKAGYYSINT